MKTLTYFKTLTLSLKTTFLTTLYHRHFATRRICITCIVPEMLMLSIKFSVRYCPWPWTVLQFGYSCEFRSSRPTIESLLKDRQHLHPRKSASAVWNGRKDNGRIALSAVTSTDVDTPVLRDRQTTKLLSTSMKAAQGKLAVVLRQTWAAIRHVTRQTHAPTYGWRRALRCGVANAGAKMYV